MRIPRRPAWPVVFLFGATVCQGGDLAAVGPLEALSVEIGRWRRIRRPDGADAMHGFEQAFAQETARWVAKWPEEELAWRERLQALHAADADPEEVEQALEGAARTLRRRPGLRFPEDTRFWMARTAVRHGLRLDDVPAWLNEAVRATVEGLPEADHPLVRSYVRERSSAARWRAAIILAELAHRRGDAASLAAALVPLTAESAVAVPDPADSLALAERARRRSALFQARARLARLRGAREEARRLYERALASRPTSPGGAELPENAGLLEEAKPFADAAAWPGAPIPPALGAAPHWLQTAQPLEDFLPDGRPGVAVVWDGADPHAARALERLQRQGAARALSFPGAESAWIQRVNPLYAAPQLWVFDAAGVIRLVGRLQPGGDGWEDAIVGTALRLAEGR